MSNQSIVDEERKRLVSSILPEASVPHAVIVCNGLLADDKPDVPA